MSIATSIESDGVDLNATDQTRDGAMSSPSMVQTLGWCSSHPAHSRSRLFVFFTLALLPWVMTIALVLFWLSLDPDTAPKWLGDHHRKLMLWGLVAASFATGFGLTGALAIIASRSQVLVGDRGTPGIGVWSGLAALFVLGSLPWIIPSLLEAGPRLRMFIALLGVLPFALVVVLVMLAPTEDKKGHRLLRRLRWWTLIFPIGVLAFILWIRFGGVATDLAQWQPIAQQLAKIFETTTQLAAGNPSIDPSARAWVVTGLVALALAPLMVLSIMAMAWLQEFVACDSNERRMRKRKSVAARVRRKPLMGEGHTLDPHHKRKLGLSRRNTPSETAEVDEDSDSDEQESLESPPPWIEELRKKVDPDSDFGDWSATRFTPGQTSPLYAGGDSFDELFGGVTPSMDQVRAFTTIYNESAKAFATERESEPEWKSPATDVVIEGAPGTGRSATAIATIIQAVVVRGETVLVLVPNDIKRRSTLRRIRRAAECAGVGWFLNIGDLTERGIQPWADAQDAKSTTPDSASTPLGKRFGSGLEDNRSERDQRKAERLRLELSGVHPRSTPDVLVGTVKEFEDRFFSGSPNFERLRDVISRLQLVVVDDLHLFDVTDRVHLRFVLNKLRLIVAGEGLRCQSLLVIPQLSNPSRDFVAEQLLTSRQRVEFVTLRPFAKAIDAREPWEVRLRAQDAGAAGVSDLIERCAKGCLAAGVEVIVYSPRMGDRERRNLEAELEGAGEATVRVIADLDELDGEGASQFGAVFYSAVAGHGASMAIRSHAKSDDVVVFTVQPKGSADLEQAPRNDLFVLPDGRSRALFASHLRSAARFLRSLQPIHRSLWSRLGLAELGALRDDVGPDPAVRVTLLEDRSFALDPTDPMASASVRPEIWGWCCLDSKREAVSADGVARAAEPRALPVAIRDLIEAGTFIHVLPGAGRFTIAALHNPIAAVHGLAERRVAEWFSEDRQSIGRGDLAYIPHLRFESEETSFFPVSFEERDGHDRGAIRIEGAIWSERRSSLSGQSYRLALRAIDLAVPSEMAFKPTMHTAMTTVQLIAVAPKPEATRVHHDPLVPAEKPLDPMAMRQFVTYGVDGTFDTSGALRTQNLKIRYEASTCFLTLGFAADQLEGDALLADLGGTWVGERAASTDVRAIVPELGAAFTIAMRRHAPGMEQLVRCIGVRIGNPTASPRYALMCIEPASTDGSAFRLLSRIVRDGDFLVEFIGSAAQALEDVNNRSVSAAALYVRAEICLGAQWDSEKVLAANQETIESLAQLLRGIADEGLARSKST